MTKIKMAVSVALLAAAGLAGTQAALASTSPAVAPSDLFAAVWNTTANTSVVIDLGSTWTDINSTSSFQSEAGFTKTFDLGNLSSLLGAAPDNFSVFAGNSSSAPNQFFFGLNSTAAAGPTLTTPAVTNALVPGITKYIESFLPGSTTSKVGSLSDAAGNSYWGNCSLPIFPGCNANFGVNALNGLGSATPGTGSLNFFEYTAGNGARTNAAGKFIGNSAHTGVFSLSGNTLTYSLAAVSSVPLPAAGWLLISGLLGFGAVSRRRDTAAV